MRPRIDWANAKESVIQNDALYKQKEKTAAGKTSEQKLEGMEPNCASGAQPSCR